MDRYNIDHLNKLRKELIRRLQGLELQQAKQGISVDPAIPNEIEELSSAIQSIEKKIGQLQRSIEEPIIENKETSKINSIEATKKDDNEEIFDLIRDFDYPIIHPITTILAEAVVIARRRGHSELENSVYKSCADL